MASNDDILTSGDQDPQAAENTQQQDDFEASLEADLNPTSNTQNDENNPAAAPEGMNLDGNANEVAPADQDIPALETRIPAKKDVALREFLGKMDDYAPIIPDAVTNYYLTVAGLPPPPQTSPHLARLLALATQKFIADIAADAYQYSRIRSTNTTSNNPLTGLGGVAGFSAMPNTGEDGGAGAGVKGKAKDSGKGGQLGGPRPGYGGGGGVGASGGRTVLTMEDLGMAVGEYGVNIKRGEFYR